MPASAAAFATCGVERRGAGAHAMIGERLDRAEGAAAEPDDDAPHAAVAHDQVGADADRR